MDNPWQIFGLTAVVLFLKFFSLSLVQGIGRLKSKVFVYPEDAAAFGGVPPSSEDTPMVQRAGKAMSNDLESLPFFMLLAMIYIQLGCSPKALPYYCVAFVILRVLHRLFLRYPRQPLRNRC